MKQEDNTVKIQKIITTSAKREVYVKDDDGKVFSLDYSITATDAEIFAEVEEEKKSEKKKDSK